MRDLIVVGGGPSGLSAAILAAQQGLSTLVIEQKKGTIDKACGEGLMPAAVDTLNKMNVYPEQSHPFLGIRYIQGTQQAQGNFRNGKGLGVRRLALHNALTNRAKELNIDIIHAKAKNIAQTQEKVSVDGHDARYLFAADGLYSPIRKKLGLEAPAKRKPRLGIRRHYPIAPWSPFVEVYWSDHAEAYVTPVSDEQIGVAILYYKEHTPPHQNKFDHLISLFPTLKEKLTTDPCSILRGSGPFERRTTTPVSNRILLVGDSAGYLDPLTGEGIRMGLNSAQAALKCILHDQPHRYHKEWKRVTRRYWWMTGGLLSLREVPMLRKLMIPTLKRSPWLFGHIVSALAEA